MRTASQSSSDRAYGECTANSRLGLAPVFKKRRLHFISPVPEAIRMVCGFLLGMEGVRSAVPEGDALLVEYDLFRVTLAQLEKTCAGTGLVLCSGFHGWMRAIWRFTEDNEIQNAAHPISRGCCNHPPAHTR